MSNPPEPNQFEKIATELLATVEAELRGIYEITDDKGNPGTLRYMIWSEVLICPSCSIETSFWDGCVNDNPPVISEEFTCPHCGNSSNTTMTERVIEPTYDPINRQMIPQRKRVPVKAYGKTGSRTWSRKVETNDLVELSEKLQTYPILEFPDHKIRWGVLFRRGYHHGITYLQHFYSQRNALVFSRLWSKIKEFPVAFQEPLQLLLLSYNSSHSTLMTRVVAKNNQNDFVITGSQSGVLYISNIPVEKNIIEGIKRKVKTFKQAFEIIYGSKSNVTVYNASSTKISLNDLSVDYVFTDPPFGDYIPYSEINQINEAWLGSLTQSQEEVIVNTAQKKGLAEYQVLMAKVLSEVSRVLKTDGALTLVFHSAKANIWQTLVSSYENAGLRVINSSILDKLQTSFKQSNSNVSVKGDPILLLEKTCCQNPAIIRSHVIDFDLKNIEAMIQHASIHNQDEQSAERLYARYINSCLIAGKQVNYDAAEFYQIVKEHHKEHCLA